MQRATRDKKPEPKKPSPKASPQPDKESDEGEGTTLMPQDGASVVIRLSMAYFQILEKEAEAMRVPRSAFLSMLLGRKRGELSFERPKSAPAQYAFPKESFTEYKRHRWMMRAEEMAQLEEECLKDTLSPKDWATVAIKEWIGGRVEIEPATPARR